jgi:hypothetical protein
VRWWIRFFYCIGGYFFKQVEKDLYSFLFGEFMLIFFHGARYRIRTCHWYEETVWHAFHQILIFFLLKLSAVFIFWIVLMCWCQKWFLKNKKNIISMYFGTKIYLKSNRYHTAKHIHTTQMICAWQFFYLLCIERFLFFFAVKKVFL